MRKQHHGGVGALGLAAVSACALWACGPTDPGASAKRYDGPTWWRDVAPVVQAKCESCHLTGGIAPFTFERYEVIRTMAPSIRQTVEERTMPPWPPGEGCGDFVDPKTLTAEEIALISTWAANADDPAAEGNPADAPPRLTHQAPGDLGLGPPNFVVQMPSYRPTTPGNDDYHCFIADPQLTAPRDVIASMVRPGNPKIVHHVILFEVKQSSVALARKLDDDEPGPGYTCFAGPGFVNLDVRWVASWAPGGEGGRLPEGTGLRLDPGSVLVMQIHYNLLNGRDEEDRTTIDLHYSPSPVPKPALIFPVANFGIQIPPNDRDYESEYVAELNFGSPDGFTIHGVGGHMHLLGTQFGMELQRAGGEKECLLDIPRWDFHWQGMYMYREPITIRPGEKLRMRCRYDNSRENQPWIDGVQQAPREVFWGEGTLDEMCLGLLYVTEN